MLFPLTQMGKKKSGDEWDSLSLRLDIHIVMSSKQLEI